jgi:hypothetical protein
MPCVFDTRPLRITLFPEHPQTILIYVPDGQALWLPTLATPFELDAVSDALDGHDVPHDTREGDRNRWWRNIKQSENEENSVIAQRQREEEAAKHVQIHLSPTATTLEKQRAEIVLMKHKVDDEIRQLKVQIGRVKANAATRGIYEPPTVYRNREQRLADLQTTSIALQQKLAEIKSLRRQSVEMPKQHDNDDNSVLNQQKRAEEAARHVQIQTSPTATTFEKQRAEIVLLKHKVDDEIRQLKVQRLKVPGANRVYEPPDIVLQRKQHLANLQTTSLALQMKLGELKGQQHQHRTTGNREWRFIQKVKQQQHLTREQYLAIWAEIDAEDAALEKPAEMHP